jgi:NAD(P)-dependent dehydrogenase (short-subunit alcohol dehydrogenase family)
VKTSKVLAWPEYTTKNRDVQLELLSDSNWIVQVHHRFIMGLTWSQLFPPPPGFTEKELPDLNGKVFIVTGGYSGVGFELASILYQAKGKVYIAGRSAARGEEAIRQIKTNCPDATSVGQLEFLRLNLSDLITIKISAETFKSKESKLDVLFNNAAVSLPDKGSTSKQGYELMMATNCLGPFMFTQCLLEPLKAAAQSASPGSVRVVWSSSQVVDVTPKHGFEIADLESPSKHRQEDHYGFSKVGNWFLASELGRSLAKDGILSVTQNPGNLRTNLLRNAPVYRAIVYPLLYPAKMGAYTELYAGFSPDLTQAVTLSNCYILPFGRLHPSPRADHLEAIKSRDEGGIGRAEEFWKWCEELTADFM